MKLNPKSLKEITYPKLNNLWKQNQAEYKYVFGRNCYSWLSGLEWDSNSPKYLVENYTTLNENNTSKFKQFGRLFFGYNGIGSNITPSMVGLISEKTLIDNNTVMDHILGVTEVGWKVHSILEELYNQGIDKNSICNQMIDGWLPEHLHYWCQCKITKQEHKADNLARNVHTLNEKIDFVHYDEAGIRVLIKN